MYIIKGVRNKMPDACHLFPLLKAPETDFNYTKKHFSLNL